MKKKDWLSFQTVCENFLENNCDENFRTIVSAMLANFRKL